MFRFLMTIVVTCLAGSPVAAQTLRDVAAGGRLRVAYRCDMARHQVTQCGESRRPRIDVGHLQSIDRDTIHLRTASQGRDIMIPRLAITQAWAVAGRRRHFWAGAGIGLLAGALVGSVIGSTQEFCIFDCSPATAIGLVLGAPVGLVLGGIVGAIVTSDRWDTVSIGNLRVALRPRRRGLALTVPVRL